MKPGEGRPSYPVTPACLLKRILACVLAREYESYHLTSQLVVSAKRTTKHPVRIHVSHAFRK